MNAATPAVTPIRTQTPPAHSGSRIALRSSKTLGWHGFGAELVNVSAGLHRIPAFRHHRVGVHVGSPVRARCFCNEKPHSRIQAHGDADVIPAGLDGQWSDESACTIFTVWIGEEFARTDAPTGTRQFRSMNCRIPLCRLLKRLKVAACVAAIRKASARTG